MSVNFYLECRELIENVGSDTVDVSLHGRPGSFAIILQESLNQRYVLFANLCSTFGYWHEPSSKEPRALAHVRDHRGQHAVAGSPRNAQMQLGTEVLRGKAARLFLAG